MLSSFPYAPWEVVLLSPTYNVSYADVTREIDVQTAETVSAGGGGAVPSERIIASEDLPDEKARARRAMRARAGVRGARVTALPPRARTRTLLRTRAPLNRGRRPRVHAGCRTDQYGDVGLTGVSLVHRSLQYRAGVEDRRSFCGLPAQRARRMPQTGGVDNANT